MRVVYIRGRRHLILSKNYAWGAWSIFELMILKQTHKTTRNSNGYTLCAYVHSQMADKQSMGMFYMKMSRLAIEAAIFFIGMSVLWHHKHKSGSFYTDSTALYYTEKVNVLPLWNEQVGLHIPEVDDKHVPKVTFDASIHPAEWMAKMRCSEITTHEMCSCVNMTTDWTMMRNCLLQKNTPMVMHSFNHVSLLAMIILWFGMTCGVNWMGAGFSMVSTDSASSYKGWIVKIGAVVVGFAFITGIIVGFIGEELDNNDDAGSFFILFIVWWITTMVAIVSVHWDRIKTLLPFVYKMGSENTDSKAQIYYDVTSTQQFLFYSNLLVVTPAIAVVIHLVHHWHDKDQMINTIFLLLSMVSIDAFSMHMTTHWESHVADSLTHAQNVQVGTIKMFAWMVNVVTIYLLLTINYPTIVDEAVLAYGLFAVLVLYLLLTFVLPDLVREFTHVYSLQALNVRIIGEFLFRLVALVYVWYHLKHHMQENGAEHTLP